MRREHHGDRIADGDARRVVAGEFRVGREAERLIERQRLLYVVDGQRDEQGDRHGNIKGRKKPYKVNALIR